MSSSEKRADGIVCFASIDWWYHNRGHSECQFMIRLARKTTVLWVNSIGMRAPRPSKTELPWRRYGRKLRSMAKLLRRDPSGMWVYSPLFVPRYTASAVRWNARLLSVQTRAICRALGVRSPSLWVTNPIVAPVVDSRSWVRSVYNRSDRSSVFPEGNAELIAPLETHLLRSCDETVYVNRELMELERDVARKVSYLDHAVDFEHFAVDRGEEQPEELRHLPRPIVGFYGALDDYCVDLELMIRVAREIPSGTLLVIGPKAMEIDRLIAEPNVVYLGPIEYAQLPRYAVHFDAGLIPWLQNEWIRACNPIKLKEYLALGFPIVSTAFPELEAHAQHVYSGSTHDEFIAGLHAALSEDSPEKRAARRRSVEGDTWDRLAETVGKLLRVDRGE